MPNVFNIPSLVPDNSVTTQKIVDGNVTPVKLSSTTLNSYNGPFSASYVFNVPNDAGNHLINNTTNIFTCTFSGVSGRPVFFNMIKDKNTSQNFNIYGYVTAAPSSGYQIWGGWAGVGPQIYFYLSLKLNGAEISRMAGKTYTNGNYSSFTDTLSFTPFSTILLPNSTGTQTLTIDIVSYGNIYGNGTVTFGGYFGNTNFELITF